MSITKSADVVIKTVCGVKKGEKVLIVTNPSREVSDISKALFESAKKFGASVELVVQKEKSLLDYADKEVIEALKREPDVFFSISANKLGKDEYAIINPYYDADGRKHDHIFHYLMDGKKSMRAVWTPGIGLDMFERTVTIDYAELKQRCDKLMRAMRGAKEIYVTAPSGTNIMVPVMNREPMSDDGDFTLSGSGGNVPAGEVFISPLVGTGEGTGCQGKIVYDGSITLNSKDIIIRNPIEVEVKNGFVISIKNSRPLEIGEESDADQLLDTITQAEKKAVQMEKDGKLPPGYGELYAKNARNIGELGIGLNPAAVITGNMLEDEKAFKTCHFAIGSNYDGDAQSLIHLDGLVKNPTITVIYQDGSECVIERDGELLD
ncbi:MAG TPA: peptidase M17 [Treponemataceae bacterium]|nr:peptidase M17 [Treponemataceae bacterium]